MNVSQSARFMKSRSASGHISSGRPGSLRADPRLLWMHRNEPQPTVEVDSVDPNDNFGFYLILLPPFMQETRSAILLVRRMAKTLRTETGNPRY